MVNMHSELDKVLHLPEELRAELKKVHGKIVSEGLLRELLEDRYIITVGDVVTDTLLKLGIEPNVAVVDYKTKRNAVEYERVIRFGKKVMSVHNPPGTITPELWSSLKKAIQEEKSVRIDVDGEEDLAVIPAVLFAPQGAMVIYGIPNTGLAVIEVTDEDKKNAIRIIEKMEV